MKNSKKAVAKITDVSLDKVKIELKNHNIGVKKGDNIVVTKQTKKSVKRIGMMRKSYGAKVVDVIARGDVTAIQMNSVEVELQASRTNMSKLKKICEEQDSTDIYVVDDN